MRHISKNYYNPKNNQPRNLENRGKRRRNKGERGKEENRKVRRCEKENSQITLKKLISIDYSHYQ